ncbi:hypothetical protein GCM10009827_020730 [Dactylosporangium maewongense]|uniref:Alpha-amylase n=1 Tax=Dactylosporangium maewongense TaxID=634393 RepID=A0ABN1ZXL3_9ACTN
MRQHALRRTLLYAAVTAATIAGAAVSTTPAHAATGTSVITVGAGATVTVDDQLPTGTISGSLLNRDGTPAWAYLTVFDSAEQNFVTSVSVPSSGAFTLDLPAGSYKLNYRVRNAFDQWSGGKTSYETAVPVEVTAGQTVQVVETVLPTGSVGGRLTKADGSPAANVGVTASQPAGRQRLGLDEHRHRRAVPHRRPDAR